MSRCARLILLVLLWVSVSSGIVTAQHKIKSSNHSAGAELAENISLCSAEEVAQNFFLFAQNGDKKQWKSLLSKSCYSDNKLTPTANNWYVSLNKYGKNQYELKEVKATRTNQKIFLLYTSDPKSDNSLQKLVLVKEMGNWKVLDAKP